MSRIIIVTKNLTDEELSRVTDQLSECVSDIVGGIDNHVQIVTTHHDNYDLDLSSASIDDPEPVLCDCEDSECNCPIGFNIMVDRSKL